MTDIVVVAHNIRSAHNVGSIFRTADGFGVSKLILSGYTPYPRSQDDPRLPHVSEKLTSQIHKSALGAELLVTFDYQPQPDLASLRRDGYVIAGLEQDGRSIELREYHPPEKIVLLLGEEVHGLTDELKRECDVLLEIPMHGKKESFNVSVAAGIALYALSV
jgi:23S rRNA (guanosine2251-2'-O)-methyltransferase